MGSHSLQAQGLIAFLAGAVLLAASLAAGGGVLLGAGALAALLVSSWILVMCKRRENGEG